MLRHHCPEAVIIALTKFAKLSHPGGLEASDISDIMPTAEHAVSLRTVEVHESIRPRFWHCWHECSVADQKGFKGMGAFLGCSWSIQSFQVEPRPGLESVTARMTTSCPKPQSSKPLKPQIPKLLTLSSEDS